MNEIVNKFLLAGDKFIPEMHLKQPGFNYSACSPFTKNKEKLCKVMQTGNTNYIYKNDLDKTCFQHDITYGKHKDLTKRTQSDKVYETKLLKLKVVQNMIDVKEDWLQWFTISLRKNHQVVVLNLSQINNLQMNFINQLLENLKKE